MRIKEFFAVPLGEKVTEKMLGRVLISSVCSILLCMGCLVSTTWAWFAVGVENRENVIEIRTAEAVYVSTNGERVSFTSGATLPQEDCDIHIEYCNISDAFNQKATLYVTIVLDEEVAGYVVLNSDNQYKVELEADLQNPVKFSWIASWFPPDGTELLESNTIQLMN